MLQYRIPRRDRPAAPRGGAEADEGETGCGILSTWVPLPVSQGKSFFTLRKNLSHETLGVPRGWSSQDVVPGCAWHDSGQIHMKPWLTAILVIVTCTGTLAWVVFRKVIPSFYANANAECVADWHAAISESRRDTGTWPDPANVTDFVRKVLAVKSSNGRLIGKGYMTGRIGGYVNGIFYDIYQRPMRWSRDGGHFVISSAGENGVAGDGDDVNSDQVKERYQPTTLEKARVEAEAMVGGKTRK